MWHTGDGMGWWMLWGGLMMILFWGAIIALVVWAVQILSRGDSGAKEAPQPGAQRPSALDIAKERYARGEINRDDFERIKRDLEAP